MTKKIAILLVFMLMYSCSNETNDLPRDIGGYYKIVSIKSDKPLDLNNDGIVSNDFYTEISGPHTTSNGDKISFYDFESSQNYMEIRPTDVQTNKAQLIDFRFPHQYIDYLSNGDVFLSEYSRIFRKYYYKFNGDEIELFNDYADEIQEIGTVLELKSKETNTFLANISKKIFDFKTKKWFSVNLQVEYLKVNN